LEISVSLHGRNLLVYSTAGALSSIADNENCAWIKRCAAVMGKLIRIAESNVKFSIRCFSKTCVLLVTGELSG
jgi:hypothetical protein